MLVVIRVTLYVLLFVCNASFALPNINFWKTKTGVPVYFIKRPSAPMCDLRVLFKAGSAYDGQAHGLSALTNNFIGLGTSDLTVSQSSELVDALGAVVRNDNNRDGAWVGMRMLTNTPYLDRSISLFKKLIARPRWTKATLNLAKSALITDIQQANQDPTKQAFKKMMHLLYVHHPYAHSDSGTVDSMKALTLPQAKTFYKQYYVRQNARILLVGDLTTHEAKQIANQVADVLPKGQPAKPLPPVISPKPLPRVAHLPFQSVQTVVMLGQLGLDVQSPDRYALSMATTILGQLPLTSILFQVIREQAGLAYSPVAMLNCLEKRGPFLVLFNTRSAETSRAVALLKKTVSSYIAKGPTQAQVKLAKDYMLGKFETQFISNQDLLEPLSTLALYHLPLDSWQKAMGAYKSMTPQKVKRAMHAHLSMQKMVLLTVGQEASHANKQ